MPEVWSRMREEERFYGGLDSRMLGMLIEGERGLYPSSGSNPGVAAAPSLPTCSDESSTRAPAWEAHSA